jgi:hypothetical protein
MLDHRLLVALLRHPSISQDLQAVAALQQTSKQLQTAIAESLLAGQLPVVLCTIKLQQVKALSQWLTKYAGVVQSIAVDYDSGGNLSSSDDSDRIAATSALSSSIAAAATAARHSLQLQSLSV